MSLFLISWPTKQGTTGVWVQVKWSRGCREARLGRRPGKVVSGLVWSARKQPASFHTGPTVNVTPTPGSSLAFYVGFALVALVNIKSSETHWSSVQRSSNIEMICFKTCLSTNVIVACSAGGPSEAWPNSPPSPPSPPRPPLVRPAGPVWTVHGDSAQSSQVCSGLQPITG